MPGAEPIWKLPPGTATIGIVSAAGTVVVVVEVVVVVVDVVVEVVVVEVVVEVVVVEVVVVDVVVVVKGGKKRLQPASIDSDMAAIAAANAKRDIMPDRAN